MDRPEPLRLPLYAAAALTTGAALLVSLTLGVSLGVVLALAVVPVAGGLWASTRRLPPALRAQLKRQAWTGFGIGCVATAAYDAARLLLTTVFTLHVRPFETWVLFGYAIAGSDASRGTAFAVGTAYHYLNGIGFSVAYCLVLGGRRWTWGVAWALLLEAAMLAVYPGWLDLRGLMGEFTAVSMSGHLAFGATLGLLCQRWVGPALQSPEAAGRGADPR